MRLKIKQFTQNLIQQACKDLNFLDKPKIILGLSGGPDSIFLLHILADLKDENLIELVAAHLDHQWRPESASDVEFCRNVCKKLNVKFVTLKASDINLNFKPNGSKEELGRRLRRSFFESLMHEQQAHFIALAHHMQDQQETFFMRLLRGSTLNGLGCMNLIDGKYIRPLLNINKQDLLEFLDKNKINYLSDSTNDSDDYLRNRIRKYLLPSIKKCDSRFNHKFKSTLDQLKLEDQFLKDLAKREFERIFAFDSTKNSFSGELNQFQQLNTVLQRRIVLHWLIKENLKFSLSSNYLDEILKFLNSKKGGSHKLSESWQLCKKNKLFSVQKSDPR